MRLLDRVCASDCKPSFLATPDIVAGGNKSLEFSLEWAPRLKGVAPLALACQDGMDMDRIAEAANSFDVLFVGGTMEYKFSTAPTINGLAHSMGKRCHIGRVGTEKLVRWAAERVKPDSIDSALPLWSTANLNRFLRGLYPKQVAMPW